MRLLPALTELFIHAFQITRPPPEQERRTQLLIGGLMLVVILLVATLTIGMMVWAFHR